MSKWLRIDCQSGQTYLEWDPSATALGTGFTVEMDVYVPTTTAQAILDDNGGPGGDTADWFQITPVGGSPSGVFSEVDAGPSLLQWNDRTPNSAVGTIPLDTSFHIKYQLIFNSGTNWDVTVYIDGVLVDSFTADFSVDGTADFDYFRVGGLFPYHILGEIYFITNVLVKDGSGSTIFSDDFTDVTFPSSLGPWTSSTLIGLSIVDAPFSPAPPIFLEAEDDVNTDPLYATIVTVSGVTYVTAGTTPEEYEDSTNFDTIFDQGRCHPQFYIRTDRLPSPGRYKISLKLRGSTNGTNVNNIGWIIIRRNGLSITPSFFVNSPDGADVWFNLNQPWPADNTDTPKGTGPTAYPFLSGDVYEFCLFDQSGDASMAVDQIRLDQVEAGGSTKSIPMLAPPEYAVGTTWTDVDARIDTSTEPDLLDMCITNDGTIYGVWTEVAKTSPFHQKVVVRKFNGSSWTTISSDLAGHGGINEDNWISCSTNGTDVFFLFGDELSGDTFGLSQNRVWRVKKWDGSALTELGTGQRQIVTRTAAFADLAGEGLPMTLAVSPNGVPWVFWTENPDNSGSFGTTEQDLPHAWYWSGSTWIDTGLMPNTHIHAFYTACIVSNCNEFGVIFADADGSDSENPFVVWGYQDGIDTGDGPARLGFDLQKWNGSSWDSILDFTAVDVWTDLRTLDTTPPRYHWHQGIHLFKWRNKVWMSAAFGFFGSGTSQAGIAALESDMSALIPPEQPYWDRPYWNSLYPLTSQSIRSGWGGDGETTGRPIVDSEGNLWFAVGTFFTGYDTAGPTIISAQENGTGDAFSLAWRDPIDTPNGGPNGGMYEEFQFMDIGFAAHGTTLYALVYASLGSDDPLLLYKMERDDDYVAWIAGQASIFWFYKDGQWRNQGVDTEYAIHFHEGGTWKKDTSLKGHLEGTWQT